MPRTTVAVVNMALDPYGYEIVRGEGYYYLAPMRDDVRQISEQGLYGTRLLNAWTVEGIVKTLLERMDEFENTHP